MAATQSEVLSSGSVSFRASRLTEMDTTTQEYTYYKSKLNEQLSFLDVPDNYGKAFSQRTPGRFLVSTAGYYHFSLTAHSRRFVAADNGEARFALMVDGQETLLSHSGISAENRWEALSFAGGVRLNAGQEVWVHSQAEGMEIYSDQQSPVFSGFLVRDESQMSMTESQSSMMAVNV